MASILAPRRQEGQFRPLYSYKNSICDVPLRNLSCRRDHPACSFFDTVNAHAANGVFLN